MFPLPLQTDNDQLAREDSAEGTQDYGHARRVPFSNRGVFSPRGSGIGGLIDFGIIGGRRPFRGFGDAAADAAWQNFVDSSVARNGEGFRAAAVSAANGIWPTATQAAGSVESAAMIQIPALVAQAEAEKAALQANIIKGGTTAVTTGTDIARQQIEKDRARAGSGAIVARDPVTGAPVVVGTGAPAKSDNTMMYVGGAAALLGLAYLVNKGRNRGSMGGYSRRHRKARKSRRSAKRSR